MIKPESSAMLSINQNSPGLSQVACSRRELLRIGTLAGGLRGSCFGLGVPLVEVGDKDMKGIMLFLVGAPSHIDTLDPKPDAVIPGDQTKGHRIMPKLTLFGVVSTPCMVSGQESSS